ncbi:MAG: hypothetical protein IPM98_04915 [Lewinellaceae bacterium]|nr:hypothetical protein [Lewinellaceae bacterium]
MLDGVFAQEMGTKPSPFDQKLLLEWIEEGELQQAFEAMKSEYPKASIHLGNLNDAEKAYQQGRIKFEDLAQKRALLRDAALIPLMPKR